MNEVYFPPTPTPNPWPKRFTVAAKAIVRTGVLIPNKNDEFLVHSDHHVFVWIGDGRESGRTLVRGRSPTSEPVSLGFALTGELMLQGGDELAHVEVFQPEYNWHTWLRPGETYKSNTWVQTDESWTFCGAGAFSYRTLSGGHASGWTSLGDANGPCDGCFGGDTPVMAGLIELKADRVSCIRVSNTVTRQPKEYSFSVPAQRIVDSKIPVRRGDLVRVSVNSTEALYWLTTRNGEVVIPGQHYREETTATAGTVHLKGGLFGSAAKVTVIARGSEWK
jgi:hypothetical protein